jgi:hypothetical protein
MEIQSPNIVTTLNVSGSSEFELSANFKEDITVNSIRIGKGANSESGNTVVGENSGGAITTGGFNSFFGFDAGLNNTTGGSNAFFGEWAGRGNTTGEFNSFFGSGAGWKSTTANNNTFIGTSAGSGTTTGQFNTAIGTVSGGANSTGSNNCFFGHEAGRKIANGFDNQISNNSVFIGYDTRAAANNQTNQIVIGYEAIGNGSNTITLGNASITDLYCATNVITTISDERDKANIQTLNAGIDFIKEIRPVKFDWNMRNGAKVGAHQFGFIAQELKSAQEKTGINVPQLVNDNDPERLQVGIAALMPIMVKAIQDLANEIEQLKKQ